MTAAWSEGGARRLSLLVNPSAGNGRARRQAAQVERTLREGGADVEVTTTESADGMSRAAGAAVQRACRDESEGRAHSVVAVGGDGTVHQVLQAIGGTGVPLGVVAAGSGDDAARAWGLPRADPVAAANVLLRGVPRAVDLVSVHADGRPPAHMTTVLATGFDAVCSDRALRLGAVPSRLRYVAALLLELPSLTPLPYRLTVDGERMDTEAMLVAVANGPSYGAGMRVCPTARPDDGLLDVMVLGRMSVPELVRVFPSVYRGTHVGHPAVSLYRGRTVTVDAPGILAFADGEPLAPLPLTITVAPQSLQVVGARPVGPDGGAGTAH